MEVNIIKILSITQSCSDTEYISLKFDSALKQLILTLHRSRTHSSRPTPRKLSPPIARLSLHVQPDFLTDWYIGRHYHQLKIIFISNIECKYEIEFLCGYVYNLVNFSWFVKLKFSNILRMVWSYHLHFRYFIIKYDFFRYFSCIKSLF